MKEIKHIVENMTSVLSDGGYPQAFLAEYDQMECLASGGGRETFLVRKKDTGQYAVAKCYDRAACPPTLDFQTLKSLDCPGVPRFYQQYQNEGMICLVREYIPGETLAERIPLGAVKFSCRSPPTWAKAIFPAEGSLTAARGSGA